MQKRCLAGLTEGVRLRCWKRRKKRQVKKGQTSFLKLEFYFSLNWCSFSPVACFLTVMTTYQYVASSLIQVDSWSGAVEVFCAVEIYACQTQVPRLLLFSISLFPLSATLFSHLLALTPSLFHTPAKAVMPYLWICSFFQ